MDINSPAYNDNRNYDYSEVHSEHREEYSVILSMIEPEKKIIDLGCGNGSLLELIKQTKEPVKLAGVEISDSGVNAARAKGIDVIKGRIDQTLNFSDNEFDYAICNVTIQMVNYPETLMTEMKRISKYLIISFPNFGFYKNRFDLLFHGRMPKHMLYNYKWFSTGHIHQLSIVDFYELLHECRNLEVIKLNTVSSITGLKRNIVFAFPNLFMPLPVFLIQKKDNT